MKKTLLLIDDEVDILEFIGYNLEKEGYKIVKATNGKEGFSIAQKTQPDLILLDLMMPDLDGIETCELIRAHEQLKDTLVVFLTARNEDYSQVACYNAGADDYITKPIKPKLLTSKINALMRRVTPERQEENIISVSGIQLDLEKHSARLNDKEIILARKEFALLALLASSPNKVFHREEILNKVWGADIVVGDRTIDVHIRKLRKKIGKEKLQTLRGIGYKIV